MIASLRGSRMVRPIHFSVRYGADLYTGFLYPDSGRFSLDCNGSFVGTGQYVAGGEAHGLRGRHRAAASAIAHALARHDPALLDRIGLAGRAGDSAAG